MRNWYKEWDELCRFAGDNALAAVGSCVALVGIFVNLIVGLSVGPNAVLANLIGQNKRDKINDMLHTILTFGMLLGVILMLIGWLSARAILELSGTVNVILNLVLVIAFGLGVSGVAIATVISNVLSAAMVIIYLHRRNDEFAFRFHNMRIEKAYLLKVLQIGIPSGIQGAIFSVSNVFIQSGINSFGEYAIAGSSLALNFEYFTYDIANAFAQAAVTFISQNYGAGNIKRCKKIFWQCMLFGFVFTEILSLIFIIWGDFFVGIYTTSEMVAAYGLIRMYQVCSLEGLTTTYEVESAALRGMGKSLEPAIFTILGTVVFRLIWLGTIFKWFPTYEMLMNVYVAAWVICTGCRHQLF